MTELLKRWAELEPEWCRFVVGHNDLVFVGPANGVLGETVTLLRLTELHRQSAAIILAAVIEAVEARGWFWSVGSTLQLPYHATVVAKRHHISRTDTPAAALLGAYLAALEAEAGQ